MGERLRVDKVLSHMGIASRRDVKAMVRGRRIVVNGSFVTDAGQHVDSTDDEILVDGELVVYQPFIYLMMNKPQGLVSATEDKVQPVVVDILDARDRATNPFPVGRLDIDTEGLLLLTNDGQLAHQLLSPKKHVPKTYFARIAGVCTEDDVAAFRRGVTLEDGYLTQPAELVIEATSAATSHIRVTIYEGKFHQVKRMFTAVDKEVTYLKRLSMGLLSLDETLALGHYRHLTAAEVESLHTGG